MVTAEFSSSLGWGQRDCFLKKKKKSKSGRRAKSLMPSAALPPPAHPPEEEGVWNLPLTHALPAGTAVWC